MFLNRLVQKIVYPKSNTERFKTELSTNFIETSKEKRYKTIQKITTILVSITDFEQMAQRVVDIMVEEMDYLGGIYFIPDTSKRVLIPWTTSNSALVKAALKLLPKSLREHSQTYATETGNLIARTYKEKKVFTSNYYPDFISPAVSKTNAEIIQRVTGTKETIAYPVIYKNDVLGVVMFVSAKANIIEEEKEMLQTFSELVGVATYNATLFSNNRIQLQIVEGKNKELTSLYNLTSKISRSLDPDVVAQIAVDSLPQDQGMIGAILTEYEPLDGSIIVKAVTQNPISDAARALLGDFKKFKTLTTDPAAAGSPTVKAILSQEIIFTDDLANAFSPPIPKNLVEPLLKILSVKSLAVYPVFSRGKIVGTIGYLLRDKSFNDIDENQKQLFQTYTTQISIALENARLFTEVERVKNNLEIALTELQIARDRERDMIDIMGHELRTPMSIVRNAVEMMNLHLKREGSIPIEKQKKYVDAAVESAKREINLIETLLSATKADAKGFQLILEKVDLLDVVHDSLEGLSSQAVKKKVEIRYSKPEKDIFVYCDRTRVQEIADNFISNAIKYTHKGFIEIVVEEKDGFGWIHTKDSGIGIDEEDLKKLGRKFFRAKQYIGQPGDPGTIIRPGGTGLGLYVSFSLIKLMEGLLDIKSKVGEGSTFSFAMPSFTGQQTVQVERKMASEQTSIESLR